ncbi:fibulin-1 [Stegastes partitus]|uniref:Fibulin-1 n=1 Tax=Stegastes partitus TaxID=144197 RepID=A0A9Y4KNJ4_9TELE|nr:PREDICTED: fibulin-1 [Stegastes partitus]
MKEHLVITLSIVQEQCCRSVIRDKLCNSGIKMGKEQGACERPFFHGDPWETKISKMCCDCCELGLTAASRGLSCELHGLSLPRQCSYAAKVCCGNSTTHESKPTAAATEKPEVTTTKPPERTNTCRDPGHTLHTVMSDSLCASVLLSDSNCSQLCVGDGKCGCHDGFQLRQDGVSCEDVNECLTNSHNCISGQVCINTEGSFRCQRETSCGTGYELTDHNVCQDIDECALGTHNCGADFVCTNTEGSFRCKPKEKCGDGYIQDAVGSCIDINECVVHTNPCQPGQTCINSVGSYTCRSNTVTCGRGYHLTEDGSRCEDVDECRTGNVCGDHGCVNLLGSYRCECKTGFSFNSITKLCDDIDECAAGTHTCSVSQSCFNVLGGYRCLSFECPPNFRQAAKGRTRPGADASATIRCMKHCQPHDANCVHHPVNMVTHTAISLPTFRDFTEPEEIVFLRTTVPADPAPPPDATEVFFVVLGAEHQAFFDMVRRAYNGMVMGVIRQVKPIIGPKELVLEVSMNYVKSGIIFQRSVIMVHVFISEFSF